MNAYSQILDDVAEKDNGLKRTDIPEELLWSLYWGNGYTQKEIAEIFGCSRPLITKRMEEYGIPIYKGYKGKVNFSDIQQQIFEGCMLGDGGLVKDYCIYPYFNYDDKYLEYVEFIQNVLGVEDISRTRSNGTWYSLRTRHLMDLNEEYSRWYPDGPGTLDNSSRKIIPYDLKLTPVSVLFWYIGDGTYDKRDKCLIFTNHLNKEDAEFLQKEIKRVLAVDNGITLNRHYDSYNIRLNRQVTNRFFELVKEIGFDVPECYRYKFRMGT